MLSLKEQELFLELARETAKSTFLSLKKDFDNFRKVNRDLKRDIKVEADKRFEDHIIKQLKKDSHFPILSEECGLVSGSGDDSDIQWIVDPLDGSLNFSRGIPLCAISIALWDGQTPLLGVVYDFLRDEIFTGLVGKGAWLNGNIIRISNVKNKNNAILCTGFPVSTDFSRESLGNFVENIRAFKKVRLLGSAALSLAYVSSGRADYYQEKDIKIWDVGAGLALVKAAGGNIKISPSKIKNALIVEAANNNLLNQ